MTAPPLRLPGIIASEAPSARRAAWRRSPHQRQHRPHRRHAHRRRRTRTREPHHRGGRKSGADRHGNDMAGEEKNLNRGAESPFQPAHSGSKVERPRAASRGLRGPAQAKGTERQRRERSAEGSTEDERPCRSEHGRILNKPPGEGRTEHPSISEDHQGPQGPCHTANAAHSAGRQPGRSAAEGEAERRQQRRGDGSVSARRRVRGAFGICRGEARRAWPRTRLSGRQQVGRAARWTCPAGWSCSRGGHGLGAANRDAFRVSHRGDRLSATAAHPPRVLERPAPGARMSIRSGC
ncbi:MAG: hypothetical protein KatS3mg015_3129 [Fimbriimonadales bacterium]|nr:MAG: hypothetical protein KatS3mg015_3129 [Fimbriimonadales bacterium]